MEKLCEQAGEKMRRTGHMDHTLNLLGFDFGASSGRAMLGVYDGRTLELREIHRFLNEPVMLGDQYVWDLPRLFLEVTFTPLCRMSDAFLTKNVCTVMFSG